MKLGLVGPPARLSSHCAANAGITSSYAGLTPLLSTIKSLVLPYPAKQQAMICSSHRSPHLEPYQDLSQAMSYPDSQILNLA